MQIHIDIETYSSANLKTCGLHKYTEAHDFEILLLAYSVNSGPVLIIDCTVEDLKQHKIAKALINPANTLHAYNAAFEKTCLKAAGLEINDSLWQCEMIRAAYCGLPLSLDSTSKILNSEQDQKSAEGKNLIKFFCIPNKDGSRNMPIDDGAGWNSFKEYCKQDVVAEKNIHNKLAKYIIPEFEIANYKLDQVINNTGVLVDVNFAKKAILVDTESKNNLMDRLTALTGLANPNSPKQLKDWIFAETGLEVASLAKDIVLDLIAEFKTNKPNVVEVLKLRQKTSKTSIKKYTSMIETGMLDNRVRGLFQFYGANRTGRWAGRLVQLQNLPRNYIDNIGEVKNTFKQESFDTLSMLYDDIPKHLSQLIRTAFIAPKNKTFAVCDFSAIEARVLAWVADETWRVDVFKSHGKIYEASAALMFGIPIEEITKGSELRTKGKIAELALGYQGGVNALKVMGGEGMGLSDSEMSNIVKAWRAKSPSIVNFWDTVNKAATRAVSDKGEYYWVSKNISFYCDDYALQIKLPSGRSLFYVGAKIGKSRFGQPCVQYKNIDQKTMSWVTTDTYGGKLTENIVQAIARDLLAYSMQQLAEQQYEIVMHIHDEAVMEVDKDTGAASLKHIEYIMGLSPDWAKSLPLRADGYLTDFYKKD
jgi:DNA polymerase